MCELDAAVGPQPDVVQQQQIQALLANVEELTRQNKELRKTKECQKAKRRRIGENQNEEESNSIGKIELQEKIPLEWRLNSAT